jgi:acetaldehyde dehydrogenase (acetylating)
VIPVERVLIAEDTNGTALITEFIEGTDKGTLVVTLRPSEYTVVFGMTIMVFEDLPHLLEGDL